MSTTSPPSPGPVRFEAVRKVYGRVAALREITCAFPAGQVSLLMGPNGAGKSTVLGIASTLRRPSAGRVLYGELSHDQAAAGLRGAIGLVAHGPMLYGELSGRENLRFFARLHGLADPAAAAERWLARVGMQEAGHKPVAQLSRGMTQRLVVARALIHDPGLLLLDEPFTGLDRQATELLRREIAEARAQGKVVVAVTHDVQAIDGLCDQLLILKQGRVCDTLSQPAMTAETITERYRAAV